MGIREALKSGWAFRRKETRGAEEKTAEEKLGASVVHAQVNDCGADRCIRSRMQCTFTPRALGVL